MTDQNQPQIIIIQKQHSGCLLSLLAVLIFNWVGLVAVAVIAATRLAWHLAVWGARVTWKVVVWNARVMWVPLVVLTRWSIRGSQALTARYGWRGWLIVGGVFVTIAILGSLIR